MIALLFFTVQVSTATVPSEEFKACQKALSGMGPHWVEQGVGIFSRLDGRQLLIINQSKIEDSELQKMVGPGLLAPDLHIQIAIENFQLGLRLNSTQANLKTFLKFGSGELVSHTEARVFGEMEGYPHPLQGYAQILFPLLGPGNNKVNNPQIVVQVALNQYISLKKIRISLREPMCSGPHEIPESWFNANGELICLKPLAELAVEKQIGDPFYP